MELVEITEQAVPARLIANLPDIARQVMKSTAEMYRSTGFQPPWIGYLALEDGGCVGTCAFKSAPRNNEVELAYFTFSGEEGRGVATRMAAQLIQIARSAMPGLVISAQTLPEENASNAILKKLGFAFSGEQYHPEDGKVWEWKLQA